MKIKIFAGLFMLITVSSCGDDASSDSRGHKAGYVKPSVNYKGQYRKGHFRKSFSTDKNAYRNNAKSRYYYQTRGKYMRKNRG